MDGNGAGRVRVERSRTRPRNLNSKPAPNPKSHSGGNSAPTPKPAGARNPTGPPKPGSLTSAALSAKAPTPAHPPPDRRPHLESPTSLLPSPRRCDPHRRATGEPHPDLPPPKPPMEQQACPPGKAGRAGVHGPGCHRRRHR
jgi:hypothetical protein